MSQHCGIAAEKVNAILGRIMSPNHGKYMFHSAVFWSIIWFIGITVQKGHDKIEQIHADLQRW